MIRNTYFFHEHFDTHFIKLIDQFLILAVIVFDSKRGKHSLSIYYVGFFIPFFTKYQMLGLSNLYFYYGKMFQLPRS